MDVICGMQVCAFAIHKYITLEIDLSLKSMDAFLTRIMKFGRHRYF